MVAKGAALLLTLTRSVASVVTATREEGSFARLETTSVIVVVFATFQKGKPPKKEEAACKDTKKGEATDQVDTTASRSCLGLP